MRLIVSALMYLFCDTTSDCTDLPVMCKACLHLPSCVCVPKPMTLRGPCANLSKHLPGVPPVTWCSHLQVAPVTAGLDDRHSYVRRTAVMGVLKIWHMNPDVVDSQGMLQHVQSLLAQDSDPQVLGNCVTLLMQVQGVKRLSSNKALVYTLINRIKVGDRLEVFTATRHLQQHAVATHSYRFAPSKGINSQPRQGLYQSQE